MRPIAVRTAIRIADPNRILTQGQTLVVRVDLILGLILLLIADRSLDLVVQVIVDRSLDLIVQVIVDPSLGLIVQVLADPSLGLIVQVVVEVIHRQTAGRIPQITQGPARGRIARQELIATQQVKVDLIQIHRRDPTPQAGRTLQADLHL